MDNAAFEDTSLYDRAAVEIGTEKIKDLRVWAQAEPVLSLPAVRERMQDIMGNGLPFNSGY